MVRNVRNASKHALRGKYLKVQLFSAFIYGINYKPFGTGHFGDAKARMLDCFLETEDTDSAIFEKHWVRIAGNFGMRAETEQDKENVLARVADMASFRKRLQPPKLGRWCAWNGCAQEQMVEFCAARMVYEHHLNCEDDGAPTRFHSLLAAGRQCSPQAELAALKRADGGFKLAYKLMSDELEIGVKRLYQATHATWEWYTAQVKEVKSPMDGLKYDMRMSAGGWARSPLLQHTVMETFYNYNNLCNMGLPGKAVDLVAQDAAANEVGTLTWYIVSNHAWSLAATYTIPPCAYANLFSVNSELRQNAMDTMRQESQNMYNLEQISLSVDKARDLADSMWMTKAWAIRLLFAFYARDRWDPNSIAGQMQLKGLLMKLADNKAVEDLHKALREKGAANRNRRLTSGMIQDILVHSRVLENRDIDHPNMVSEDYFKAHFLRTKMSPLVWRHKSAKHLMPAKVDQILLWPTRKSSARSSSGAMRRISSSSSRLPAAS